MNHRMNRSLPVRGYCLDVRGSPSLPPYYSPKVLRTRTGDVCFDTSWARRCSHKPGISRNCYTPRLNMIFQCMDNAHRACATVERAPSSAGGRWVGWRRESPETHTPVCPAHPGQYRNVAGLCFDDVHEKDLRYGELISLFRFTYSTILPPSKRAK
jgi:hypothetical protein